MKNASEVASAMNMSKEAFEEFLSELLEGAMHLGFRVILAIMFFLVGIQIIKLVRKVVKKSMQRANAELGAIQFVGMSSQTCPTQPAAQRSHSRKPNCITLNFPIII